MDMTITRELITTTKAMNIRNVLITALMMLLMGCESSECDRYRKFVEEKDRYDELVAWADNSIFFHAIRSENIEGFGLAGPGRDRLVLGGGINYQPPSLPDVEIRLIGSDPRNPIAVFLGRSSYKGLIIGRGDVSGAIVRSSVQPDELLAKKERVALVCRPFR